MRVALVVLLLASCTTAPALPEDGGSKATIPDGGRCAPGFAQSCACLGGGEGTQVCRSDASGFGACTGCAAPTTDGPMNVVDLGGSPCGVCDGCCDGTTCVPLTMQTDDSCGVRGASCSACAAGTICAVGTGQCASSMAGCGTCAGGCCQTSSNGTVCLQDQPSACGASCTACTYGVTCASGACTTSLDSTATFHVYVKSASVTQSSACPSNWDDFSDPDPQVFFGYQSGGNFIEGHTQYASNTFSATYDDSTGLIADDNGNPVLIPASAFIAGTVRITLEDYDYPDPNDQIAQGYFPATSTYMATYATGMFGCAMNITFQLR